MLDVSGLDSGYDKIQVLREVALTVDKGERVVLMGRNGMGKTTLAKTVVGLLPAWNGSISVSNEANGSQTNSGLNEVAKWSPDRRAKFGIGYVPQGRGLFPLLSVEENLRIGLHASKPRLRSIPDSVYDYFPVLKDRRDQLAGTLSGGEQQQLSIGRALVGMPSVLILDEPSEGIQPNLVAGIADKLRTLATDSGIAVLLIEQNLDAAKRFAERCFFMENGRIVHTCQAEDLEDGDLIDRLLGV